MGGAPPSPAWASHLDIPMINNIPVVKALNKQKQDA